MKKKILAVLESSDGYVSGEQLSKQLGVSRTAVWKYIGLLREEGYKIDSVTHRGYRLAEAADLLDIKKITPMLHTSVVGTKLDIMKSVDSTNEEVKRRAAEGEKSGLVIAAEKQTGGKGRLGRTWQSDSGGIYFTVLLKPDLPPNEISAVTLAAGYGMCLAVREYTGLDAKIKWPNDIIIGNKKVCGILTEMAAQTDRVDYVAIGIGINVNHISFPDEIKEKATSLYIESGKKINRNEFFACILKNLDMVTAGFMAGFTEKDKNNFKSLCATLDRQVSAVKGGVKIEGTAFDLSSEGDLMIRDKNGTVYAVNSGEVVVQGIY